MKVVNTGKKRHPSRAVKFREQPEHPNYRELIQECDNVIHVNLPPPTLTGPPVEPFVFSFENPDQKREIEDLKNELATVNSMLELERLDREEWKKQIMLDMQQEMLNFKKDTFRQSQELSTMTDKILSSVEDEIKVHNDDRKYSTLKINELQKQIETIKNTKVEIPASEVEATVPTAPAAPAVRTVKGTPSLRGRKPLSLKK